MILFKKYKVNSSIFNLLFILKVWYNTDKHVGLYSLKGAHFYLEILCNLCSENNINVNMNVNMKL